MSGNTINEEIENLSNRLGCTLTKLDGKFNLTFDIRNLDFVKYRLKLNEEYFELYGICEMLAGTSNKPSYFSGNTSVQNRFSITCKYKNHKSLPKFSIYESGIISKLVHKRYIKIKSKDTIFNQQIDKSPEIKYLEERVKNTAEVSPAINCRIVDGLRELTILFQSFSVELDLFEKMIELSKKLNTEYNNVHDDHVG